MSTQLSRFVLLCLAGACIAVAAKAADPYDRKQREETIRLLNEVKRVELELETEKRFLPPTFDPEVEEAFIRTAAGDLELALQIRTFPGNERVSLPNGKSSPIRLNRMEISGHGDLDALHELLRRIGIRSWRAASLEQLDSETEDDGTVRFAGRLVLPTFEIVEEPSNYPGNPKDEVPYFKERLLHWQALLDATRKLSSGFDSSLGRDAVAVLDSTRELRSVQLTDISLGDHIRIRGVLAGTMARDGLLRNLEKSGYRVDSFRTPSSGLCRPFALELTGGSGARPTLVFDEKLNDERAARFCGAEPKRAVGRVVAKGASASGPITMHLRDVEIPSVFYVLRDLTGENFIVDEDARGQVRVDIEHATPDESLAAMKSAGLVIGPAPLRRVSLAGKANASDAPEELYTGEPINLDLQDVSIPDVFCLFSNVTGLPIVIPDEVRGRATIFVRDLPWDQVLAGLLRSAGLEYRIETDKGTRLYAGSPAAIKANRPGTNACEVASRISAPGLSGAMVKLTDLVVADMELAGIARSGGAWKGYARISGDRLTPLMPDDQLLDGRVKSVGPASVVFATAGSPVEVSIQP